MVSAGATSLFERPHHRRVATLLEALDAALLEANACWFSGGTAIALRYGEFRESVDVDFLVSDVAGYRSLRQRLSGPHGLRAILRAGPAIAQAREVRADQYGVRTWLDVAGTVIKLEIVLEGRVALDHPAAGDRVCGVACATTIDLAATKLLANSDRWADDSTYSRDLIDLAMMKLDRETLKHAVAKASLAYGVSIERDLAKAIDALKRRPGRLEDCMRALQMNDLPPGLSPIPLASLWKEIRRLGPPARRRSR